MWCVVFGCMCDFCGCFLLDDDDGGAWWWWWCALLLIPMKLLLGGNQYFCHPIIPSHHLTSAAALAASVLCICIYVCYCNLNSSFVLNRCSRSVSLVFSTQETCIWNWKMTILNCLVISLNDPNSLFVLIWHCCVCAWWLFSNLQDGVK